jgi:tetratricopeptide (TPR) repeat protein
MSSVRRYDTLERDSLQAGRELGVDAVVDGSIQRSGESLRVSVRLLRVADGAALWADTFSAPFSNVFSVQDNICSRIVSALAPELGQEVKGDPMRGRTSSTQAYERYLQGRYHLARLTPADLRLSVDHFRAAVALDPDYAQAWLGLASVQFRIPIAGEAVPREFYPLARQAAERALRIDPSLAEGHAMLGWIDHWFEWDWAASEANFQRAIKMDPNNTESHLGYAHLLSDIGRHEQAIEEVRRARELSPFYTVAAALEGGFLMRAGRAEEAVRQMEEARGTGDSVWLLHASLASGYLALGRYEDALAEVQRAREISGESTWAMATETSILSRMGRRAEAEAVLAELLQRSTERYVPPYDLAVAHHALGDLDSALAMLEQGFEVRDPKMVFLAVGGWGAISERPAFQELLKRMNLQAAMK